MDDEGKIYRRGKPQQKLYTPGSGPLRKSSPGLDGMMENLNIETHTNSGPRGRGQGRYRSKNYSNEEDSRRNNSGVKKGGGSGSSNRGRKPEQQLYVPKAGFAPENDKNSIEKCDVSSQQYDRQTVHGQSFNSNVSSYPRGSNSRKDHFTETQHRDYTHNDFNYNRNYRQASEPRSMSPAFHHDAPNRYNTSSHGGKPPSGRRNSAGYSSENTRPKFMMNLDDIPPRFRKKFLAESGQQTLDSCNDYTREPYASNSSGPLNYNNIQQYAPSPVWSQTLPSRGRGRLREQEGFDKEKFITTYLKNYEKEAFRYSTSSNSNINNTPESRHVNDTISGSWNNECAPTYSSDDVKRNCAKAANDNNNFESTSYNQMENPNFDINRGYNKDISNENRQSDDNKLNYSDNHDDDAFHSSSNNLENMASLDWNEEVEKSIKLDDLYDSSISLSSQSKTMSQEVKPAEVGETRRSGKSKRRERRGSKKRSGVHRSSSRGNRAPEKPMEPLPTPQPQVGKLDRNRKDSGSHDSNCGGFRQRERERRDSHRSNRSSTIGNSREDLDRWRSWRSYSREQSTERRIPSQCNSRDTSLNRATSPRDNEGFRIPQTVAPPSNGRSSRNQRRNSGSGNTAWSAGRTPSKERGRTSPAPNPAQTGGGSSTGEGGKRRRRSNRKHRDSENIAPTISSASVSASTSTNWREEILESKKINMRKQDTNKKAVSTMSDKTVLNGPSHPASAHPGLLILPSGTSQLHEQGNNGRVMTSLGQTQKLLFDHHNPSKPIIVQSSPARSDIRIDRMETTGKGASGYEPADLERAARHRALLHKVERADVILHTHSLRGPITLAAHWQEVIDTRKFLQNALQSLLVSDLKFCQVENVEHHFWKILYYNLIEDLRKGLSQVPQEDREKVVSLINTVIEEGNTYFENLVQVLEKAHKFNVDDNINGNNLIPSKGLGYIGLALISVQKLYVFLGDLARYKEQVNETNNYAKSKFWYTKAQQVNPKNGRPYNQLAILAVYARRKLDAVYYYMRSLMSSNPFRSARESLISLFDENRKKYEAAERKRRAAREAASGASGTPGSSNTCGRGLRREVWVRPSGGRTTTLRHDTRDEHLANMSPVELNKNFITSYLHVHGKLITKIGMETFHECAGLMLRQFRALLSQQPLPTPLVRLLQLTALNMFAVENTVVSNKDQKEEVASNVGLRSAWLDCALGVSFLMFGLLLERCSALLHEPVGSQQYADALLMMPAIKVWCDWMLCHSSVWNPPPSFDSFNLGSETDPWDWLAKFMNILEALDDKSIVIEFEPKQGCEPVRLQEDTALAGFTPLMYMEPAAAYAPTDPPHQQQVLEHTLRVRRLLFFGTEYLIGVDPPVLRLHYTPGEPPKYISAVVRASPADQQPDEEPLQDVSEDSEGEESAEGTSIGVGAESGASNVTGVGVPDEATRKLLRRKEQLEARRATMDRRRQRMQEILRGGWVSVEVEVRPRWLVPDTNCFIDHLPLLQRVAAAPGQPYLLAVPLVVVTELEGLCRCSRVGTAAASALTWLGGDSVAPSPAVRFVTTRGSILTSRAFTAEKAEPNARHTNDDKVLSAALNLLSNLAIEPDVREDSGSGAGTREGSVRRVREVVLLTDDRNLRVKALAAELPARDLPAFVQWAALNHHQTPQ